MSVGLSANIGAPIDDNEPLPALTTLLTLAATALMFLTDLHLEVFKALEASYTSLPISGGFAPQFVLGNWSPRPRGLPARIEDRQSVPDLLAGAQRALGLIGRLVPGIQSFFLAAPFLLLGGLVLLSLIIRPMLMIFIEQFSHFLVSG